MIDVICIGRSSVDLYGQQVGGKLEDMSNFSKYVGGSPTNISIGCSRLGLKSALITKVGNEHMGRFIKERLEKEGVDISNVKTDKERLTALVLLGIRDQSQFPLIFYRENCADMALSEDDIDEKFIENSKSVLVTGTHFSSDGVSKASFKAIEIARKLQKKVVLDIDYRPNLWTKGNHNDGESRFKESKNITDHIQKILPFCDLIVGTEEEWKIAGGTNNTIESLKNCRKISKATFVCKRGALGCTVFEKEIKNWDSGTSTPVNKIEIFNVLGAGDGFMSGFLKGWINDNDISKCSEYGNACGALAVSRHGCAPSYPSLEELNYFMKVGSTEFSLRKDKALEQIHWSTNRNIKYDRLFAFAFDHRTQFENWIKKYNKNKNCIETFKSLALRAAISVKLHNTGIGILVDDLYGREALEKASDHNIWIGRPIEVSGKYPLRFQNDEDLTSYLNEWPVNHCVKVLAPVRMDDTNEIKSYNEEKLLSLFKACRNTNHEFLLEIITSYNNKIIEPEQILKLIDRFYSIGIFPDWWKIEPIQSNDFWNKAGNLIRKYDPYIQGIVVLGKNSNVDHLKNVFESCKNEPLVKGFAIGRSIFSKVAELWLSDKINDEEATKMMSENFLNVIKTWNRLRS